MTLIAAPATLSAAAFIEEHSAWTVMGRDDSCLVTTSAVDDSGAKLTFVHLPDRAFATIESFEWTEVPGSWQDGAGNVEIAVGAAAPVSLAARIDGLAILLTDETGTAFSDLESALAAATGIGAEGQPDLAVRDAAGTAIAGFSLLGAAEAIAKGASCAEAL
ncbi:hypothetical protein OEZ60_07680 [Defluviimonas sp. WL0024]|uniref:Uncharacterized protein n=1 Tax=Albidovulum salinarum TaxID=2984153 RepID=A0ABT2X7X7_9RHOB|nr:hypothetical protein [Defluviimonas sp. WL0024]MCU9847885.1 hypothetical protein [Defluviimonas sp. WL0024]